MARMGNRKVAYGDLVERPERKRALGKRTHRWEDNIKMDLQEAGWGAIDLIAVAQDRDKWRALVNAVVNFRAP